MARKRIQGITIQLDGETKGLDKALKDVNKRSGELHSELKEVEKALKFNPGNTELIAQKQKILADQVANSTKKLDQLKEAQIQVDKQFQSGDIGEEQYRAFKREVIKAESQLDGFKKKLSEVDDGKSLDNLEKDMKDIKKESGEAKGAIGELGSAIGGLAAGAGAAGAISEALNFAELDTQIDISFNVPEESKKSVKQAVKDVAAYGVDAEEALEGVRRQWALNADASDEVNSKITKSASVIASAYAGIDFTELIQETNEIAAALNITNEEALGLTDSLLKAGFPPEQIDIIAEYGTQLSMAGFEAEEVQAIFASGVDTKTWNIDNLIDGLKEGNIKMKEFGEEVPKAMTDLLEGTDISAKQLRQWGKDVAEGGDAGKKAMSDVATALVGIDDETKRSQIGVQLFGTMYEDQGQAITDVLINAKDATFDLKTGTDGVKESIKQMDANPVVQMKQAFNDMKVALAPLLETIASVVSKVATWAAENPKLTATIVAIATAITIISGAVIALTPVVLALSAAAGALGITMLPLTGIILAIVAAIGALVAAGIWLWKNWDTVKAKAIEIWGAIKTFFAETWQSIKSTIHNTWSSMKSWLSSTWSNIKALATSVWSSIKKFMSDTWNAIKSITFSIWNAVKSFVVSIWNGIKNSATSVFNGIRNVITTVWNRIRSVSTSVWNGLKSTVTGIWNGMKSTVSSVFNGIKNTITGVWDSVAGSTDRIWDGITGSVRGAVNGVIRAINGMIRALNGLNIKLPKIPDWVPGIGGKGGGSISFPNIPNVPYLDVGTNYVSKDGLAYLHEGEAVVPKKYNPQAGGTGGQIIQNITINSPQPLSPSENARKIRQASRQLAMEW